MDSYWPDVYLFNPTCEYAVASGQPSWQPNLLLQKMEEDLCTLPLYFGCDKDVIIVKKMPSEGYLKSLGSIGINPPAFFPVQNIANDKTIAGMPKNRLVPWGWSPAAHRLLEPLKPSCSAEFQDSPVARWKPEYRDYYSRKFARDILISLLPVLPPEYVIPAGLIPEICTSVKQVDELLSRWGKILVKAPWSSSGRGLQAVTKRPVVPKVWEKLQGIIREQGYIMVEPYLNRQLDLALQFELKKGKVEFKGISRFFTDKKGQYQGNYLNGWKTGYHAELIEFAETMSGLLVQPLAAAIESSPLPKVYEGIFGIDTLIFPDEKGKLRINPCLEINLRLNMGLLSLRLEKLIEPGRKGIFKIGYHQKQAYLSFLQEMELKYPPVFNGTLIHSGFFSLVPADEGTLFGAYLLVA
jgi:hypothetical protein